MGTRFLSWPLGLLLLPLSVLALSPVDEFGPPTTFSCLNDLLTLRNQVAKNYVESSDFSGGDQEKKAFAEDYRALEGLIWPSPRFPVHIMKRLDFYQDKLIPAYKYFDGAQSTVGGNELRKARESQLLAMDAQSFYRTLFFQGKSDLSWLKKWGDKGIPSRGQFSDRYRRFKSDEERMAYFDLCANLFEEDTVQSEDPSIKDIPRGTLPSVPKEKMRARVLGCPHSRLEF